MSAAALKSWNLFPLRKRTGTAGRHLLSDAVDFSVEEALRMRQREAVMLFAEMSWGSKETMPCPHCSTIAKHYWSVTQLHWKWTYCGKRFSVTSGTVFAGRKLPLTKIIGIIFSWANGASGKAALHLRRDWNVAYATVFTLIHKVREGLLRGFNTGVLVGVHEMDGMDINGRRYREKRNKPQGGGIKDKPKIPRELLKSKESEPDFVGPRLPPKFGKTAKQPPDRRVFLVLR